MELQNLSALRQVVGPVNLISAESSIILRYNDPELGIDKKMNTSAKFVADEDSFWYQVHFDGVYCVDQVMSLDSDIYTHTWTCLESGCGTPCEGLMCTYVDITVLNKGVQDLTLSQRCKGVSSVSETANCGDGVRLSISKENAASLGYDYFEISEFSVTGRKQGRHFDSCLHLMSDQVH